MNIEDKLAIQELIAQYAYLIDGRDAAGYAQLWVENGVLEIFGVGATTADIHLPSRKAIHEWAAKTMRANDGIATIRHFQMGTVFDELNAEMAKTRTMILATRQEGINVAPSIFRTAVSHEQLCKTSAGWRFTRRTVYLDQPLVVPGVEYLLEGAVQ